MEELKAIWNYFCEKVEDSVKKQKLEKFFEKNIAKEFFMNLGWQPYNGGLREQLSVKIAASIHKADLALFIDGKDSPEIIIELKRPNLKKKEDHVQQLLDYMDKTKCSYGILMMGEFLEVHYRDYSAPISSTLVETIKYRKGNDMALQFLEILHRDDYKTSRLLEYCHKRLKINKSINYWCSADGMTEIMDIIVERSNLSEALQETLRQTLTIDVKRKDGIMPIAPSPVSAPSTPTTSNKASKKKSKEKEGNKVWMISAKKKFFDHKACFEELGKIYWKQFNKIKVGDTGYIYFSKPVSAVLISFEVIAVNEPFCEEMAAEKKYYKRESDFEAAKAHNRFFVIRKTGESTSGLLTSEKLLKHGLKKAPQGAIIVSDPMFGDLQSYIEDNF